MIAFQDYVAILNLYARYEHLGDAADPVVHSDCFTADGSLIAGGRLLASSRQQIANYRRESIAARQDRVRRHYITNIQLDSSDGSVVRGQCYVQAWDYGADGRAGLFACGTYEDIIKREEGTWRFLRRTLTIDYQSSPTSYSGPVISTSGSGGFSGPTSPPNP